MLSSALSQKHTGFASEALREKLKEWKAWSYRSDVDNGLSRQGCTRLTPFNQRLLDKFALFASAVPFAKVADGRLLDASLRDNMAL